MSLDVRKSQPLDAAAQPKAPRAERSASAGEDLRIELDSLAVTPRAESEPPRPARKSFFSRVFSWIKDRVIRLYVSTDRMDQRIRVISDVPDVNAPTPEVRQRLERLKAEGEVHLKPDVFAQLEKLEAACRAAEAQARRDLADPASKAAAEKAIAALPAQARQQLAQLSSQLAGHPRGLAALQRLARDGKLLKKDAQGGHTLLHHLHAIGTQPVPAELKQAGQANLLAQTLTELAQPEAIAQKGRNTCAATCLQHIMAERHPAEYARLIAGLASSQGVVQTATGKTLARHAQWTSDEDWSSRDGNVRSISSRLLQPALMQHGGTFDYDNVEDGHVIPVLNKAVMGMLPHEIANTYRALTGERYNADVLIGDAKRERVLKGATPERPVLLALNYAEEQGELGPHWLEIVGYDEQRGEMIAYNPRGQREAVPLAIAESHFLAVVYPPHS